MLRDAADRQSDPASRFALARLLASLGRTADALAALDGGNDVDRAALLAERGRVLFAGGRVTEAVVFVAHTSGGFPVARDDGHADLQSEVALEAVGDVGFESKVGQIVP